MSGCRTFLHWRKQRQCLALDIPVDVSDWLFDPSSLTARLMATCPEKFRVEVLSVEKTTPTPDEILSLKLRFRSRAIIRQVLLYCDETPVVYARTIIPMSSLRGPLRGLAKLGTRPLGAVLFADNTMERSDIEVTALKPKHICYQWTKQKSDQVIWGRRSVFKLHQRPLLVSEFFLPDLLNKY